MFLKMFWNHTQLECGLFEYINKYTNQKSCCRWFVKCSVKCLRCVKECRPLFLQQDLKVKSSLWVWSGHTRVITVTTRSRVQTLSVTHRAARHRNALCVCVSQVRLMNVCHSSFRSPVITWHWAQMKGLGVNVSQIMLRTRWVCVGCVRTSFVDNQWGLLGSRPGDVSLNKHRLESVIVMKAVGGLIKAFFINRLLHKNTSFIFSPLPPH